MLAFLRIRGLALLEDVSLDLSPGLNVLTGETGAGKSIIVDALALLRGARGRSELIRAGEAAAHVEAQFELAEASATVVAATLQEHGTEATDEPCIVAKRVLPRAGRGRCFLQSQLVTQGVMASVGEQLLDICSQHEHHSLTQVQRHVELLDGYASLESEVAEYGNLYAEYKAFSNDAARLRDRLADGPQRAEFLRFQIDELERADAEPGEFEALTGRVALMRDAQRWASFSRELSDTLYEGEDSVSERLARYLEQARRGTQQSEHLTTLADQLALAQATCEEALQTVQRFAAELEIDPGALEQAEARLSELKGLTRKHGASIEELSERLSNLRLELEELDSAAERLLELEQRAEQSRQRCVLRATGLHQSRAKAARHLASALEAELSALHIPKARLQARVELMAAAELGPRGLDRVEFLFSANPGEPLAPLTKVASGGELSRVLLALKGTLATGDRVATYVFDEVDAGVGGAVADAIGQRLSRASAHHQVICITHLPQIAAFADAHFRVEKHVRGGRTSTRVVPLSAQERNEELARMLGGARIKETARQHARELLDEAERVKQQGGSTPGAKRSRRSPNAP